MEWNKFYLSVLRHPIIRKFKAAARCHILDFVELSVRFEPPGVVQFYDDEIASDLGMGLDHWIDLRDEMAFRGLIRRVQRGERRVYEIAEWLLPLQSLSADGRTQDAWSESSQTVLLDIDVSEDYCERRPGGKSTTAAERQAWRRYKNAATVAGETVNRSVFLADYRTKREASEQAREQSPSVPDVTENVTNEPAKPVTNPLSVTAEAVTEACHESEKSDFVTRAKQTESEKIEIENNNTPRETVTEASHEFEESRNSVVVFLSEKGIPIPGEPPCLLQRERASQLAEEVFGKDGSFDRIYDQAKRLPFRNHKPGNGERAGFYICSVRGTSNAHDPIADKGWGGPDSYEKDIAERAKREDQARRREKHAAEIAATTDHLEGRIAAAEKALTPEARDRLDAMALAAVSDFHRERINRARRNGDTVPIVSERVLRGKWAGLLLDQLDRDAGDGACNAAG